MAGSRKRSSHRGDIRFGYLSVIPALIIMSFFSAAPLIYALVLSFQDYDLTKPGEEHPFIGVQNYSELTANTFFFPSLTNTIIFTLGALLSVFILSLAFALVLNEQFKGNTWVRVALLVPWAIPEIANALGWKWIFDSNWGVWNGIMVHGLHLFTDYQSWLGNPDFAMFGIIVPHVWREVPLATILLMAGISTVPPSLYEAATLDGANALGRFRKVTLPMLRPIIQLVLVYETIAGITSFAYVWLLTGGGPGYTTTTFSWLVWMTSFSFGNIGQGSAVAVVMSLTAIVFILLYFRLLPTKEFGVVAVR